MSQLLDMTTCGPIKVSLSIVTFFPITEYAPISTVGSISQEGSIIAV